ncbi:hypothetical protein SAICODRAFT_71287 [Saitoella complicata NRRL Y-17804]|uniref:uncharacterized protein n=1 Tax=Saitoella complicata (strain BCRC 22490 / CBS 7301 / JCM 7358 / NBRC 10748 / NRRL Y-17804) TaxID=698492 RepID=UPI000867B472|nr:uncharacterized protein SAICODRAFT_71287 [Saitoella complicata NRRL Y-17804]ODQ52848.1 hypothetical protein SAICODRAFT_71287 [Saitoella complicata NRRL Y-17804]
MDQSSTSEDASSVSTPSVNDNAGHDVQSNSLPNAQLPKMMLLRRPSASQSTSATSTASSVNVQQVQFQPPEIARPPTLAEPAAGGSETPSSTVSEDTADPLLIGAMENPKDRLFILKLEQDIRMFIKQNTSDLTMELSSSNSYHRLLAHRTADYYRLLHVKDVQGPSVVLFRSQKTRIPAVRLADMAPKPKQADAEQNAPKGLKIMKRQTGDGRSGTASASSRSSTPSQSDGKVSREEREAAYQEARARIFKGIVESPAPEPEEEKPKKNKGKPRRAQFQPENHQGRGSFPGMPGQGYYPQYDAYYQQMYAQGGPAGFNPNPSAQPFVPMGFDPYAMYGNDRNQYISNMPGGPQPPRQQQPGFPQYGPPQSQQREEMRRPVGREQPVLPPIQTSPRPRGGSSGSPQAFSPLLPPPSSGENVWAPLAASTYASAAWSLPRPHTSDGSGHESRRMDPDDEAKAMMANLSMDESRRATNLVRSSVKQQLGRPW